MVKKQYNFLQLLERINIDNIQIYSIIVIVTDINE